MKAYGQFCPLAQATQLLCQPWTLIVVREFIAGSTRYSELQKGMPTMSPTLLSTRLKQLVTAGVLERIGKNRNISYQLTQAGRELTPVVQLLGAWGHRWVRTDLSNDDLDAGLLMWDMRRSINVSLLPTSRVVVEFNYPDAIKGAKKWWLITENGEVDLCLNDPGHEVNLLITSPLITMTAIWTCQLTVKEAIKQNKLKVIGESKLIKILPQWLCSSLLSKLGTVKQMPTLTWNI